MDESLDLGFEEQILEPQPEEEPEALVRAFATVGAVYADGLSLIFDGETEPTEKHYLCNTSVYFQAGDRVRLAEDSGTYIVEYVVGPPKQARTVGIPAGGAENQVLTKATDADFAAIWKAVPHEIPASGTTGYVLTKTNNGFTWQAITVPSPLWIPNPAYSANPSSSSYVIQFRTANYYGDGAKQLQFRVGTSGSWITLATA